MYEQLFTEDGRKEFGLWMKSSRKKLRLKQGEVASFLGINQSSISDYECARFTPAYENYVKIKNFFQDSKPAEIPKLEAPAPRVIEKKLPPPPPPKKKMLVVKFRDGMSFQKLVTSEQMEGIVQQLKVVNNDSLLRIETGKIFNGSEGNYVGEFFFRKGDIAYAYTF